MNGNKISLRGRFLDVLYELKFRLTVEKISGKMTILKSKFREMIEDETAKDIMVRDKIDELFSPLNLFKKRNNNMLPIVEDSNSNELESSSNEKANVKSNSLIKTLPQFRGNNNSDKMAA